MTIAGPAISTRRPNFNVLSRLQYLVEDTLYLNFMALHQGTFPSDRQ